MTAAVPAPPFATLTFTRRIAAPPATVWQVWTAPVSRALWSAPAPTVTVEFLEADSRPGGREVSLCKAEGYPDVRCEVGWLVMQPPHLSVNHEIVGSGGTVDSVALVTARITEEAGESLLDVTIQLSSISAEMEAGYRQGYGAGLDNLAAVAGRCMVIERVIRAPLAQVWGAWWNADSLPQWWGPDGFSCRTARIDLRAGGEWVFDMIAPDGTVFPNHHRYGEVLAGRRLAYTLHWGENGPKHADAWAAFDEVGGETVVTLGMVFATAEECRNAKGFGAEALGLQTLGKLARAAGEGA